MWLIALTSAKPVLLLGSFTKKIVKARNCVKVEVTVLVSPSLIVRTVSVDVKQH